MNATAVRSVETADRVVVYGLALACAGGLLVWDASPAATYLVHDAGSRHPEGLAMLGIFTAAWLLMALATMLPSTTPLLTSFRRVVGARTNADALTRWVIGGLVVAWATSGLAVAGIDLGIHSVAEVPLVRRHTPLILAGSLVLAGAYQLSPVARRCLHGCRSPFGFIGRHWSGRDNVVEQSLSIGFDYGCSCLGCCAPLMVVMFAVGMGNPAFMVTLGVVGGVEKRAPWGPALVVPIGLALLGAGALIAGIHLRSA